jgi:hypothetical protein
VDLDIFDVHGRFVAVQNTAAQRETVTVLPGLLTDERWEQIAMLST